MKNNELNRLIKTYQNNEKKPITFDFKRAYNSLLTVNESNNINYHHLHFYPGRIYPYIARYLLSLTDIREMNGTLLDPFAGSGTILLESLINPFISREVLGVEINPLGRLISKVKITPFINISLVPEYLRELHKIYSNSSVNIHALIPIYENIDMWFSKDAISKLAKLKYAIQNLEAERDIKDFFWLCFSSIIRKVSKADPYIPPPVVLKLEKYRDTPKLDKLKEHLERVKSPNLWKIFEEEVLSNCKKLDGVFDALRDNPTEGKIIWDDAREIKKGTLSERGFIDKTSSRSLPSNSVSIIFTSPPYLTAQKYIRTSKLELLWLGYSIEKINELEKKSIGTERIKVSDIEKLGYKNIDELVKKTLYKSRQRALAVYFYFKNMIEVVRELNRILKNQGYMILVVGDNKVLGKWIGTYRLLADIVINEGFRELVILKDTIKSRSMLTRRNGSGGLIKEEYVMIFQKEE
ncbi:hypothetical protein DRQ11_12415 [candidate division KSB1 bacterium]|nr:MAG: hypothetical protein DRQ11_12415 [candidate division KSB1 bacterium]